MPAEVVVACGCTLQVHCKAGDEMPLEPFCDTDFFNRGICTGDIDEGSLSLVGAKSHSKLCLEQLPQIGWTSSHYAPVRFLSPFPMARGALTFIRRALQRLHPNLLLRWGRRQGMVTRRCGCRDENNCVGANIYDVGYCFWARRGLLGAQISLCTVRSPLLITGTGCQGRRSNAWMAAWLSVAAPQRLSPNVTRIEAPSVL
jgi:hypothetical protein